MSRDDELDAELETHLRMAIEERVARGESRDAAEYQRRDSRVIALSIAGR